MLGRYLSAIRAACANERSCGSERGEISNGRPYRDLIMPVPGILRWDEKVDPRSRIALSYR